MMCSAINNSTSCEIRVAIGSLVTKILSAAEILSELRAAVCGQNVMIERTITQ
jgi:hypothetical protein